MIQQSHLIAWQTHAPWPKRSQIEQDLRLSRGVAAIFADPVLAEHLAMRGGTVLHKGHLAPAARYSEDIDLVLVKPMNTDALDQRLRRVLTPVLGEPDDSLIADAWLAIRNVLKPSRILRTAYKFVPLGLRKEETIKVEVNLNENASLCPLVNVEMETLDEDGDILRAAARSYDINEMLGTKTRALMQREQGRDLYDLSHAWQLSAAGATPYVVDGQKVRPLLPGTWRRKERAWGQAKPMLYLMHASAKSRSGGIWIRCCAPDCRNTTLTTARRSCVLHISSICSRSGRRTANSKFPSPGAQTNSGSLGESAWVLMHLPADNHEIPPFQGGFSWPWGRTHSAGWTVRATTLMNVRRAAC